MINVPGVWSLFAHSKYHHKLIAFGNVFVLGSLVVVCFKSTAIKSKLKSSKWKVCQKSNVYNIDLVLSNGILMLYLITLRVWVGRGV